MSTSDLSSSGAASSSDATREPGQPPFCQVWYILDCDYNHLSEYIVIKHQVWFSSPRSDVGLWSSVVGMQILQQSLCREARSRAWCEESKSYEPLKQVKTTRHLRVEIEGKRRASASAKGWQSSGICPISSLARCGAADPLLSAKHLHPLVC